MVLNHKAKHMVNRQMQFLDEGGFFRGEIGASGGPNFGIAERRGHGSQVIGPDADVAIGDHQ